MKIKDVLDKGEKDTLTIYLKNGNHLTCTPDHEILTDKGWIKAEDITKLHKIMCNGKKVEEKCPICGSTEDIIKKGGKFNGYCRKCMYKSRKTYCRWDEVELIREVCEDGYVFLRGRATKQMPNYGNWPRKGVGVPE